jgi:tetratricopeptide (TPR) repeat protein
MAVADTQTIATDTKTMVADARITIANTETAVADTQITVTNTQTMVADIHRKVLAGQEGTSGQNHLVRATRDSPTPEYLPSPRPEPGQRYLILGYTLLHSYSIPLGELPPPAPRDCFGRDELIEKVVGFAENLKPVALIGAGGIGKTSVALTVLHHDRVQERFGENRRFIRCDQFPASPTHLLARISRVIGAGVENPEDLIPLRPFLSSKEILIILDNAESILDPKGANAEEIYSVVDELSQFKTICLLITSRITTVPPRCKRPQIPTLSMEAACDIFYDIYNDHGQSSIINDLLERLDFHALSITLLATAASHNAWDYNRLAKEWDTKRAQVLQTHHNKSLAATIELSLSSPTFRSLGPNARDLLGVIAFFPQGIYEEHLDWLFPSISNGQTTFDTLCVLSLTYRSSGFVRMLAPIRDYLGPQDPRSSPLLCATRDQYFIRLSVIIGPGVPGFEEARWIVSEDANVEHLLDIFTSFDQDGGDVWDACYYFMQHIYWHKPRQTMLKSKIEALPDVHLFKPKCLYELSRLFERVGNYSEQKRLLTHALELRRRLGDSFMVAYTLQLLSLANLNLEIYEEGIQQAKEALEHFKQIGDTKWQMQCSENLAWLFLETNQLDTAEDVASHAINLAPGEGHELFVCRLHRVLGSVYRSKGEKKKAIHHFETAIRIGSPFNWHDDLFWIHFGLAKLFRDEGEFDDANVHIERLKSHAINDAYKLGCAMEFQAGVWHRQLRLEEAKSEALHALEIYENLGAAKDAGDCRNLLQNIELAMKNQSTSSRGKLLYTVPRPTSFNFHSPA